MTRTATRHTLSALSALALVSAFAVTPTPAEPAQNTILEPELKSAQAVVSGKAQKPSMFTTGQSQAGGLYGVGQLADRFYEKQIAKKAPKGLATRRGPQASAGIDAIDMGDGTWILSTPEARR